MEDGPLPSSLEEVVNLVIQLYQPGAPEKIAKTQETLQRLQRSTEGWQLASSLLNHQNQHVRFFAALTFIVKLNTDAKSLNDEDAQSLLNTLVSWLVRCMENSEGALVVRKLCSALVTYFLQFSTSWQNCVKHLICCLYSGKALPYSALDEAPEIAVLVQGLSDSKAVAIFWFAAILVEEVGKTDSSSMKQYKFHRIVVPNAEAVVSLISKYIVNSPGTADVNVRKEAMITFSAWVNYSHRAYIDDEIVLEPLRELTRPALMCLGDDVLYETTIDLFSDTLTNYSKFLRKEDFDSLQSLFNTPWAQERYNRLVGGDYDFDSLQFGMFMIAFGDATVQNLTKNIATDPQCNQFLTKLTGLLAAEGYAIHEDKIYVPALEFWTTYVETMVDDSYSEEDGSPAWFPAAQAHVMQVIRNCWRKSQFPPASDYNAWDSVDRTGFKDARRDFSDLLQQFYLTTKIPLLQIFIDQICEFTETKSWSELEASMFCLSWFADSTADHPERDEYLDKAFNSSVMALFANPESQVPTRAMKGFLDLVYPYTDYFQRRPAQLPVLLNIVFEATGSLALAKTASRAIMKICSDCRTILLPELETFLRQYGNIATNDTLEPAVKASIMEGITSIIQTMGSDEGKAAALDELLNYVEADVQRCLSLIVSQKNTYQPTATSMDRYINQNASPEVSALDLGVLSMKCLVGMGRGCQVPEDRPVDLDHSEVQSSFWTLGKGSRIQNRIYTLICQVYDVLGNHGDIVEEICSIWRVGFREMEPGAFVLPPNVAAQFLMRANLQTPRLVRVIHVSSFLISTHRSDDGLMEVLANLLTWLSNMLQTLGEPREDPEVAQSGIEFIHRLITNFPRILLSHQPPPSLEFLFMFTLKALAGSDPLPKSSAAEFWTSFISLDKEQEEVQTLVNNAMGQIGPLVSQALIYNIGGHAQRSELEKLSEPIKRLIVRHMYAKKWLEAALLADNFPSDKVTTKDKMVFLQKITNLRGARGTNQVVRDFWLACRGMNFAYAS